MKITTWNINSVRARLDRALAWLDAHRPDLLCLQETKVTDDLFPEEEFKKLGYHCAFAGQKSYNGVALLARQPLEEVEVGFSGDPLPEQMRVISAVFAGLRVYNLYVPNGSAVGTDKYDTKLLWLDRLQDHLRARHTVKEPLMLCGDYNIAPEDRDVHDPQRWRGKVLCSEPERSRFRDLLSWGLVDALRMHHPEPGHFTWWDYRMGGFRRNLGLRIDHFLVSRPLSERITDVLIDREERGGDKPSDHAPVTAVLS